MCFHSSNVSQLCARRVQAHIPACHRVRNMGVASVLFFLWPMSLGASLDFSPLGGGSVTPEGSKLSAPEGGKLLADERGITLTPEGGTLSYAPEGGKFPLPASFLSCSAAHFDSCGGVQQTWPFLCFCYGIPLLLTLCALTRMKWTKKKTKCVVAARKAGKSRFRQKRRSSRCVFVIDLHIWPVLLGVPCNRYVFSSRNPLFKLRSRLVVEVISPHERRKLLRMMRAYQESKAEDVFRVVGDSDGRHSCSPSHASSAWRAVACNSPDVIAGGTDTLALDVAGWVDSNEELQQWLWCRDMGWQRMLARSRFGPASRGQDGFAEGDLETSHACEDRCVLPTLQSRSTAENDAQRSSIENWVDNDEHLQSWLWSHDPSWQLLLARGAVAEFVCHHDAHSERESNAVGAPGESTSRFRSVFGMSWSCGAVPFDTSSVTSVCDWIATVIQCSSLLLKAWQGWRIAAVALIAASFGAHAKSSVWCSSTTLA